MQRKKVVTSYKNLTSDLLELVHRKYPNGYQNHVFKVAKPNNDFFHAITLDTDDTSYLIKVNVKIDTKPKEEDDKDYYGDSDSIGTEQDTFPDEADEADEDSYVEPGGD